MHIETWCTKHLKLSLAALMLSAGASFGQADARLAFMSDRSGKPEIYVMNPDGSSPVQVTASDAPNEYPALSHDGMQVAFVSRRSGSQDIFRINIDGSDEVQLTDVAGMDFHPAWSPDGTRIAFASDRDGNFEIYVMNADGSGQVRLTSSEDLRDVLPTWSPDGRRILFTAFRSQTESDLFVVNADGTDLVNLTDDSGLEIAGNKFSYGAGTWSPDGMQIAYAMRTADGIKRDIWVMDADGTNRVNVSDNDALRESKPVWSPDGRQIAYYALENGPPNIWIMDADGSRQTKLTLSDTVVDVWPSFAAGRGGVTLIEALSWGRIKATIR